MSSQKKKMYESNGLAVLVNGERYIDDYCSVGNICDRCKEQADSLNSKGIAAHGIFCADITSLSDLREAQYVTPESSTQGKAESSTQGKAPRLALTAVGCSLCSNAKEADVVLGIKYSH